MAHPTIDGWRRALAAVLVIAFALAGAGRATAAAAASIEIAPGLTAPICHPGGEAPADPAAPAPHDCCDACALLAPAVLPAAPALALPVPAPRVAERTAPPPPAIVPARERSPRQSRGPPRG